MLVCVSLFDGTPTMTHVQNVFRENVQKPFYIDGPVFSPVATPFEARFSEMF